MRCLWLLGLLMGCTAITGLPPRWVVDGPLREVQRNDAAEIARTTRACIVNHGGTVVGTPAAIRWFEYDGAVFYMQNGAGPFAGFAYRDGSRIVYATLDPAPDVIRAHEVAHLLTDPHEDSHQAAFWKACGWDRSPVVTTGSPR